MKSLRTVAVYILNSENQVLLIHHKKANAWFPPGGKVEDGELVHEAAIREVKEEVGLHIDFQSNFEWVTINNSTMNEYEKTGNLPQPVFVSFYDKGNYIQEDFFYISKVREGKISNKENLKIGWFNKEDVFKLDTFNQIKKQVEYITKLVV